MRSAIFSAGAVLSIIAAESASLAPISVAPTRGARKHKIPTKPPEIDLETCSRQVRRQLEREAAKAKKR